MSMPTTKKQKKNNYYYSKHLDFTRCSWTFYWNEVLGSDEPKIKLTTKHIGLLKKKKKKKTQPPAGLKEKNLIPNVKCGPVFPFKDPGSLIGTS